MSNNQDNGETAERAGIRRIASQRMKARHRSKAPPAQTQAASPPPPPSSGQCLDDHLGSLQEEQDEFVQSGTMDGGWAWAERMRAKRLGKSGQAQPKQAPLATSRPEAPRKTLADVYRSAGSGLTLQFEGQTSPTQSGEPKMLAKPCGPEPTMEELARHISGLMRAGVREDLRDSAPAPSATNPAGSLSNKAEETE